MNPQDMDRRTVLGLPLALATSAAGAGAAISAPHAPKSSRQVEQSTPISVALHGTARYLLYLPAGYFAKPGVRWPAIFFLHGSGERGRDLSKVKIHGMPKLIEAGTAIPAIVVSPQCEDDDTWDAHLLHGLLMALRQQWRIDPARVTVTGLSMGGAGCWDWAMRWPDDLAGIAPVCGYGRDLAVARMRKVPVKAYHGEADTVVPLAMEREVVDALREAGGQVDLTVYPGVGHDAWNPAYADPALVAWLLARRRA